jgi:uncharacterized protein YacL
MDEGDDRRRGRGGRPPGNPRGSGDGARQGRPVGRRVGEAVFVEVSRLMVVILCTGLGYQVLGGRASSEVGSSALLGACLGAGIGYVQGGVIGRALEAGLHGFQRMVAAADAATLLAGAVGALVLGAVGVGSAALRSSSCPGGGGGRCSACSVGSASTPATRPARRRPPSWSSTSGAARRARGARRPAGGQALVLIDSSAAIDGRLVATAASGFLPGRLAVPRFVLDELQGIADAADPGRRRRGRRALEALAAVQQEPSIGLVVWRTRSPSGSRSTPSSSCWPTAPRGAPHDRHEPPARRRAAGVRCLDLAELGRSLQPVLVPGESVRITVSRLGRDAGQGVGYLEDGTMVVVSDGGDRLGDGVDVTIASSVQTSRGRMLFASLSA